MVWGGEPRGAILLSCWGLDIIGAGMVTHGGVERVDELGQVLRWRRDFSLGFGWFSGGGVGEGLKEGAIYVAVLLKTATRHV